VPDTLGSAGQAGRDSETRKTSAWRKIPVLGGLAAFFGTMSARQAAASIMLMTAGPIGAAGFVYEVKTLRRAQLEHEAADRVQYAAFLAAQANDAQSNGGQANGTNDRDLVTASINKTEDANVLSVKIDAMIHSRSVLLDTFGDDPSAVAPVYAVIIKQMLRDDEDAFAALKDKRASAAPEEAAKLTAQEAELHDLHVKLAHLARV
jgi:hypothetical protein